MRETVATVMTTDPITVTTGTPYPKIAEILDTKGISAVPVVDGRDRLVGVVSEADLLARLRHTATEERPAILAGSRARRDWNRSRGILARDLMTSPAETVTASDSLSKAALLLARKGVRRLVVVEDGRPVGIVSRRDLLRGFHRTDDAIRAEIEREVLQHALWALPIEASVTVEDGIVTLLGRLESRGEVERAGKLAAGVLGVVEVRNRLDFVWDDRDHREEPPFRPTTLGI